VQIDAQLSTGIKGLDQMLKGLIPGDNIVWQIDTLNDYKFFIKPYCESAAQKGRKLVYFRFAGHEPLLDPSPEVEIHELDPRLGFELFISQLRKIIGSNTRNTSYIFDCLSDLADYWYSDRMFGNFFMLICPYILDIEAIAFFALFRDRHCSDAIVPIHNTAQIVIDVFRHREKLYVHPLKVQQRYSSTMYMLHCWDENMFKPVTESSIIAEIMNSVPLVNLEYSDYRMGVCNRAYLTGRDVWQAIKNGEKDIAECRPHFDLLSNMFFSRDRRVLELARKYMDLGDILAIRRKMIGTGLIGGKSVGMLLARAILNRSDEKWKDKLEPHDSYFIGSDVFYTYIVQNGNWWIREKKSLDQKEFLQSANEARRRMLTGRFPYPIQRHFSSMLDYFGQSPIIVRSSSLLEDNYGNAFSGKYESVFCANQGSRDKRLQDFLTAVRTIYASSLSEKALLYRQQRGLLDKDEQMALLVQRVSGSLHKTFYMPQVAGVAYSYNPYVWSKYIDPDAGIMRLVFGLGTRAVDRSDDDYTRIVALNAPERRPESNFDKVKMYEQKNIDVIDLESNQLVSTTFAKVAESSPDLDLDLFSSRDLGLERRARESGIKNVFSRILTFDKLLSETDFVEDMKTLLQTVDSAYSHSVDIEFAANFFKDGSCKINLLQCRPFQIKGRGVTPDPPAEIAGDKLVIKSEGAVIGQGRKEMIDWIIYVDPDIYGMMPVTDRYSIARLIGIITHHINIGIDKKILLIGPGRWGSSMPSLGVPVTFAEINTVSALCEVVAMSENLIPDVSLGTHYFNDLVESDILYLALFPQKKNNFINTELIKNAPNRLSEFASKPQNIENAVRVVSATDMADSGKLKLYANTMKQKVLIYLR